MSKQLLYIQQQKRLIKDITDICKNPHKMKGYISTRYG